MSFPGYVRPLGFGKDLFDPSGELTAFDADKEVLVQLSTTVAEYHIIAGVDRMHLHAVNLKRHVVKFGVEFITLHGLAMHPIVQGCFDKASRGRAVL